MKIKPETLKRLEDRVERLRKTFGQNQEELNVRILAEHAIVRFLNKKDHDERFKVSNKGITWCEFKRENFDEIYTKDRGVCRYCTVRVSSKKATLDHILAPIRGGLNVIENMAIACSWCNKDKGILTDEEYRYKQLVNTAKGIIPK